MRGFEQPCFDCNVDTNEIHEYYMVRNEIWQEAKGGGFQYYLCIGCLEDRLGRKLTPEDFTDVPCNREFNYSKRLAKRLGYV